MITQRDSRVVAARRFAGPCNLANEPNHLTVAVRADGGVCFTVAGNSRIYSCELTEAQVAGLVSFLVDRELPRLWEDVDPERM